MFQFLVANKTEVPLYDLKITAHFNEQMQIALINSTWYNEGINLGAYTTNDYSYMVEYSWSALIDLLSIGMMDAFSFDSLFDAIIEIEWAGGHEMIQLSQAMADGPFDTVDAPVLDESAIEQMMKMGIQQRILRYGE